jgi:IS30 family transposase
MNYTHLNEKKKVEIDILLKQGLSMRKVAKILNISHSTISRYKARIYHKRKINIHEKYEIFIKYLYEHYDRRYNGIEVCIHTFKQKYKYAPSVSYQQVYKWIIQGKIDITRQQLCYKKRRRSKAKQNGMMNHLKWNLENKTVLPIRLRPKKVEQRDEVGHLEIDSIIGKKNENKAIISIVDRCTRRVWLIKAEYTFDHYTSNLIYKYIIKNGIEVKSITTDNGLEFNTMGIAAKKLGVKLYKCDAYCSFQRGSNEQSNGIVRRWIKKGESLKMIPQIYLDDISFNINAMPRKKFNFKSSFGIESMKTKELKFI